MWFTGGPRTRAANKLRSLTMSEEPEPSHAIDKLPGPLGCLMLWIALAGLVVLTFVSLRVAFIVIQRPLITHVYGPNSYSTGLRVVGRHGELSNGQRLPGDWTFALNVGVFAATLPILFVYIVTLRRLGMMPPDRLFELWKAKKEARQRDSANQPRRRSRSP